MNNIDKNKNFDKTVISWYPGHMVKTKRLIKEVMPLIDVIYELIDARIPFSSKIDDINDLVRKKPRILIMTKYDLCDHVETNKWVKQYEEEGYKVVTLNLKNNQDYKKLIQATTNLNLNKKTNGDIKVLVMGIPNVGKSTLINVLAGKKSQKVENKPGVTKDLVWLNTKHHIKILDTPGILWSKLEDNAALNLAAMTSIKDSIIPEDDVAFHILKMLHKYYPNILENRYKVTNLDDAYQVISQNIGAIRQGEIDEKRVSMTIINDVKNEKIIGVTFDRK